MQKECIFCQKSFFDKTKRKMSKTCCKTCASAFSVLKRKQNGSYKRTPEQNRKMVETFAALRLEGKATISKEKKKFLSEQLKERWKNGSMKEKTEKSFLKKCGKTHWTKTDWGKEKISKIHKGKKLSPEMLKLLSARAQKQNHRFSKCKGGYREDLKNYFRSSWEANFARILNFDNISWEYEKTTFILSDSLTYTPDFQIGNIFFELKGWETDKFKYKFNLFKTLYPDVIVVMIYRDKYKTLEKLYKRSIENWE
jgi:hypothetical protein